MTLQEFENMIGGLCKLQPGWCEGQGGTYKKESFENIKSRLVAANKEHSLPFPYVFPKVDDNYVRLEWDARDDENSSCEMDLDLVTNKVELFLPMDSEDHEFDLENDWAFILSALIEFVG